MNMNLTQNQKHLINSGALWAVYNGLTGAFLVAFALVLGASNTVIGILAAIPYLAIMLAEYPGAKLVEFYSRRRICIVMLTISRLLWIPICLLPILFRQHPLLTVVIYYLFIQFTEYIVDPAWVSIAGDIVPVRIRGKIFATRNMIMGIAGMITSVAAATYLDLFPKNSLFGFSTMFVVGIVFGLWAVLSFSKIKEPEYQDHRHYSLTEFFKLEGRDFRKFVFIVVFFNFAVNIASPFFTVYMLKNLEMSYTLFMVAAAVATLSKILAQTQYGKVCDRYGDKPVAIISFFGTALVPLAFMFITKDIYWFVFPAQILSGIVWAGVDLSTFNLLLDLIGKEKRAVKVAEYATITALPMIIAPIIGGYIADNAAFILTGIPLIFGISFILRASASLLLFTIHEPRAKKEHALGEVLLRLVSIHPVKGLENVMQGVQKIIRKPGYGL
ncbi:MAG: MFS transporter [Candidatus Woesearchaeota archaeon]